MIDDDTLLAGFRDRTLSRFSHEDHVRTAFLYLREHGRDPARAAVPFGRDLLAFATAAGAPRKYDAALTAAWMALVAARMSDDADSLELLRRNPDLATRRSP